MDFGLELLGVPVRPGWRAHRSLHLMVDEGTYEIALRFNLELGGHARRALAAVGEGEQPASCGRQLLACLGLRGFDTLEKDWGRIAKNERCTEAERPDQLGPLPSCWATVRTDARSVMLLAPKRQSALGWPVGDAPAGLLVEPEAAGGRGRIGREKALPDRDAFLLRYVVPGVVRILRPAIVSRALSNANSSRGGLRSGADRRGPASIPSRNASPHSMQLTTSRTGARAGRAFVSALAKGFGQKASPTAFGGTPD